MMRGWQEFAEIFREQMRKNDINRIWPVIIRSGATRPGAYDTFYYKVRNRWQWRGWSRDRIAKRLNGA